MPATMVGSPAAPFHVACQYTGMHVCYCLLGTPVGLEADFATKVKSFWDAYRSQLSSDETLEQDTVEVEVPRLIRRTRPFKERDDEADQQNKKDIEKALQKATKAAEQAIRAAAKSHAQAGLEFEPPAGFQIDLSVYQKDVDSKQLDEQLAAARARYNELRAAAQAEKASIPARKEGSGHRDAGASPQAPDADRRRLEKRQPEVDPASLQPTPAKRRRTQKPTPRRPVLLRSGSGDLDEGAPLFRRAVADGAAAAPPASSSKTITNPLTNDEDSICGSPRTITSQPVPSRQATVHSKLVRKNISKPVEKRNYLAMSDFNNNLKGRTLQVQWTEDKTWWQATVTSVNLRQGKATLWYPETGDEENIDLVSAIKKREVAFVDDVVISDDSDNSDVPTRIPPVYPRLAQGGPTSSTRPAHPVAPVRPASGLVSRSVSNYKKETVEAVETLLMQGRHAESTEIKFMPQGDYKWKDGRVFNVNQQKRVLKIELNTGEVLVLSQAKAGLEYALEIADSP